jgi:hypothetical protein
MKYLNVMKLNILSTLEGPCMTCSNLGFFGGSWHVGEGAGEGGCESKDTPLSLHLAVSAVLEKQQTSSKNGTCYAQHRPEGSRWRPRPSQGAFQLL